jgi:signal peptidase II
MKRWLAVAGVVVVLDQLAKYAITRTIDHAQIIEITPFFNLVLWHNTGAAFSFLAGAAGWQRLFFCAIAAVASVWIIVLLRSHAREPLFCMALSLILGGALGNLIDRIWLGAVTDFLDFHAMGWHFPAFNVADAAITCGAALIVMDSLRTPRKD